MKLLLDTHIWLWTLEWSDKLGTTAKRELRDPNNELWLSPISSWEALTLHDKGRIHIQDGLQDWIRRATARFREAPLTHEIALAARLLPFRHQDPADRFLAATAQVLELTLLTADARLLGLGEIATMANR